MKKFRIGLICGSLLYKGQLKPFSESFGSVTHEFFAASRTAFLSHASGFHLHFLPPTVRGSRVLPCSWYYHDNMAAKLTSFPPHPPILSPLLKKASDAVPPMDELEQLYKQLKLAKEEALERSKKASDDLRKTIEEPIRRITEREKDKFKAIDKIKRERDCTLRDKFWKKI